MPVHQIISFLRAPWMDLTQNIFIKINDVLDLLHGLFDWRDPLQTAALTGAWVLLALLCLWLPFHEVLHVLLWFLFLFFTPVWEWGGRCLLLPIKLPLRIRALEDARNAAVPVYHRHYPGTERGSSRGAAAAASSYASSPSNTSLASRLWDEATTTTEAAVYDPNAQKLIGGLLQRRLLIPPEKIKDMRLDHATNATRRGSFRK